MTDEQYIRNELKKAGQNRKASEIATAMNIAPSTVKRWIDGGDIPPPMLILLDLYFFGTIPFEIANQKLLHGILDFTEDQWKVVSILATRQSVSPGKWIANQIRSYLAFNEEAKAVQSDIVRSRLQSLPPHQEPASCMVAEEPN